MNTEQERAAFEAWRRKHYDYDDLTAFEIEFAFAAFQAGRAALQSQPTEAFPCRIIEADFETGTVTLEMQGKYTVSAGQKYLCNAPLQSQEREEVELSQVGRAIYRACSDLPDGYEIRIDLEKGSGIVYVTDRDGDETMIESGDKMFSYQINEAIDHARRIEENKP